MLDANKADEHLLSLAAVSAKAATCKSQPAKPTRFQVRLGGDLHLPWPHFCGFRSEINKRKALKFRNETYRCAYCQHGWSEKTELNFCCCIYSVRGNVGTHPINMKVMIGSTVGGLCATYVYSVIFVSLCPEALFHLLYRNPSFLLQDELNCSFLFSDKENHNSCIFQQQVCACYLQRGTIHTLKKHTICFYTWSPEDVRICLIPGNFGNAVLPKLLVCFIYTKCVFQYPCLMLSLVRGVCQ